MPPVPEKEIYRYLGYHGSVPEDAVLSRLQGVLQALQSAAVPRLVYRRFPLQWVKGVPEAANLPLASEAVCRNLQGCREVYLLAATLGSGVDRLMARYAADSAADMVLLQAAAAACLEEVLDREEAALKQQLQGEGYTLRPRFSPGYGGLSLSLQEGLLDALSAGKHIGLHVTSGHMLTPEKSVTAFAGICPVGDTRVQHSCAACDMQGCAMRKQRTESEDA